MSNEIQVPIFRAKKIDSDEYVEGCLIEDEGIFYIVKNPVIFSRPNAPYFTGEHQFLNEIDPSTLSIHFPDMLDSEGTKIFASLSESGLGGDMAKDFTFTFDGQGTKIFEGFCINEAHGSFENFTVTGIQEQ